MSSENLKTTPNSSSSERDEIEQIALQHTVHSAISSEFQKFSFEEKAALVSGIYTAFVEAIKTGEPICPSNKYDLTPEIYNEFLAHAHKAAGKYHQKPLKVLTQNDICLGVHQIFERAIYFHGYTKRNAVIIYKSRILPTFELEYNDNSKTEVTGINISFALTITVELNKILVNSDGSLSTALKLINQLLNEGQPPVKDIG